MKDETTQQVILAGEPIEEHQGHYSDERFWAKVGRYAKAAGEVTLSRALTLYYAARDKDTPVWAKTTIYGALGYFISPLDALPDLTPLVGYTDDMCMLAVALMTVAAYVKDEHKDRASATLKRWFS
ncbi:YkvA family protein [Halomonas sp. BN3-1]|uniref:YkvA family protein n=1 Tax=Halomonas sp. BN3-1 TaxID=2082393 RepID=UPI000D37EF46|nr:YkvA family protein [Halomonas sp. BN3-1]